MTHVTGAESALHRLADPPTVWCAVGGPHGGGACGTSLAIYASGAVNQSRRQTDYCTRRFRGCEVASPCKWQLCRACCLQQPCHPPMHTAMLQMLLQARQGAVQGKTRLHLLAAAAAATNQPPTSP